MITLEEFKKALGDYANELTEQEIVRLKQIEEDLVDILFEHIRPEHEELKKIAKNHGLSLKEAWCVKEIMDEEGLDEDDAVELKDDL